MKHIAPFSALLTIALVTGCAAPRVLTVVPVPKSNEPASIPAFTMTVQQPAAVSAPPPCARCIGEGYDSTLSVPVVLKSTGYSGPVQLSVAGLPAAVAFVQGPIAPVTLVYGEQQTVNVKVYVLPGATPGSYSLTIVGTSQPGANSTAPVSLPLNLTITGAWGA